MSHTPMRHVVLASLCACLSACASTLPASETTPSVDDETASAAGVASQEGAAPQTVEESTEPRATRVIVHAPGRSADELLAAAGMTTYLADHDLHVASIDAEAMERWFTRKPSAVFLYAERPIETGVETSMRGDCQRLPVWEDVVLNGLSVVLTRHGNERAVLEIGQERVAVTEDRFEERQWQTNGVRALPMGVIAWDDAHIAFAEGAEIHEVACVSTVRAVLCSPDGDPWVGPRGFCVARSLVVRPWRPPFVPHVGPVSPAYPDAAPSLPEGSCEVECAPNACDDALQTAQLPRVPLYTEQDPMLAVFRTQAACRAFATSRGPQASGGVW